MEELIEQLQGNNLREVANSELIEELNQAELLQVYDKLLDFVDMDIPWNVVGADNPNVYVIRNFTLLFDDVDDDGDGMLDFPKNLWVDFHNGVRNKTKFLFLVASVNLKLSERTIKFLSEYLSAPECNSMILGGIILKCKQTLSELSEHIIKFWLTNKDHYFFNDPKCEVEYVSRDGNVININEVSNFILQNIDNVHKDLYPTLDVVVSHVEKSFEYDLFIAEHWPKKWIIRYYNVDSSVLFDHIPTRKIYELLLSDPTVNVSVKQHLLTNYEKKPSIIQEYMSFLIKEFKGVHNSIPDILPDSVKRLILEKTIRQYPGVNNRLSTFHGNGDEVDSNISFILDRLFQEDHKRKSKFDESEFEKETKYQRTKSNYVDFTNEQKKWIKKLAKKYKEVLDRSP